MNIKEWFATNFTLYKAGFTLGVLGIVQFLIFLGLDKIGVIDVGNGIGPGMLMWLCWALGGVLIGGGLLIDIIEWFQKRYK